ncbi:STAS domain-containing protein [Ferdinandcohnia quinoae]|uniref:STAS domain-containing protein n=1 Tax=Fredinandcohnia quinoae TaxID=2918902 RepID=A0AAW5DWN0_9BACI|nr:STAS domain-containing protein [Fredinandcohnia sp. SECRCQ15]MCH1625052.1 STAS domain-containing protein [Fredinandcohnia sp. SECRCQ15]
MGLTISKACNETTLTLFLEGILDISTANVIDPYLEELDGINTLIIDFSKLEFIDSTGIGSIMGAIFMSKEKGLKLKFQGEDELTKQVLETVGLYDILNTVQGEVL